MEGWIISQKRKDEYKDYQTTWAARLEREALENWINVKVFSPEQFDILVHREDRKSIIVDWEIHKLPDFIIPRSTNSYFALAIIRHMERLWVFVLNTSDSIEKAKDKLYSSQLLAEHSLPVPNTMLGKFPIDINIIEKQIWFPLVLKTLDGSQWTWVFLSETKKEFERTMSMLENIWAREKILILQEYIQKSHWRDLRVFIIWWKVIACMERNSASDDFRANYSLWWEVKTFEVTPEIEWIATQSAHILWLEVAGVDLLFEEDWHFKICEVNAFPWLKGIEEATNINVTKEIFDYIRIRLWDFS